MLIEVKARVSCIIDAKTKKTVETFLVECSLFTEAEYTVTELMERNDDVEEYEILSLRISPIKEVASQYQGEHSFVATLRDTWTSDEGTVKHLRYKVLLWADNLTQANQRTHELAREGYDMLIEGIKQVDYHHIVYHERESN